MWKQLGELGVLGVTVDAKYGGLGLGYLDVSFLFFAFLLLCVFVGAERKRSTRW